eukprot:3117040-Ditylum_brightwellii.AAC.1
MQEQYTDTQLDWPNIKARSKLCDGGICLYRVKARVGLQDDYIANTFGPGITSVFGIEVSAILRKVLLWAANDNNGIAENIPATLQASTVRKLLQSPAAHGRGNDFNPIERVKVIPSQQDGAVSMDIIPNEGAYPKRDGPHAGGPPLAQHNALWKSAIYAKLTNTHTKVSDLQNHVVAELAELKRNNRRLTEMVWTLMVAPDCVIGPAITRRGTAIAAIGPGEDRRPTVFGCCPRTFEVLWDKWQNGLNGNKPARLFTRAERGRDKHKYTRRNVFWKCMVCLIRNGSDVANAIGRIKEVYGVTTVTRTINSMKPHERVGGHYQLQA